MVDSSSIAKVAQEELLSRWTSEIEHSWQNFRLLTLNIPSVYFQGQDRGDKRLLQQCATVSKAFETKAIITKGTITENVKGEDKDFVLHSAVPLESIPGFIDAHNFCSKAHTIRLSLSSSVLSLYSG